MIRLDQTPYQTPLSVYLSMPSLTLLLLFLLADQTFEYFTVVNTLNKFVA